MAQTHRVVLGIGLLVGWGMVWGETLRVGPGQKYGKPCAAVAAAKDGDVIEIDGAGVYVGDVCAWTKNGLTLRGVNGRPHIQAGGQESQGKGTWVVNGNGTTVENVEMSGAEVADMNGAAIRLGGVGLTLRRVYFHDNQEGLLTSGRGGDILVEYSEFDRNGDGEGYAHNLYVTQEASLTVRFSYFHRAKVGHVIKSRAARNYLYYNRFASEEANSSLEIDLPNGGFSVVVGNVIQQGVASENRHLVGYMEEGPGQGYDNRLLMAYNTLVIEGGDGGEGVFQFTAKAGQERLFSAVIVNNIIAGEGGMPAAGRYPGVVIENNLTGVDAKFVNGAGGDYRLAAGSPAIGMARADEDGLQMLGVPALQAQGRTCGQKRPAAGRAAVGAYEYGEAEWNGAEPCVVGWNWVKARVVVGQSTVKAAGPLEGWVLLDGVAPVGGAVVRLTYSRPDVVTGPEQVELAAGSPAVAIPLAVQAAAQTTAVTITAEYGGVKAETVVTYEVAPGEATTRPPKRPGGRMTSAW